MYHMLGIFFDTTYSHFLMFLFISNCNVLIRLNSIKRNQADFVYLFNFRFINHYEQMNRSGSGANFHEFHTFAALK